MKLSLAIACLLLVSFAALPVQAQLATTSLNGNVSDPSGAAVAGAKLTAISVATGLSRQTASESDGRYVILNLAPGSYNLRVEAPGFATGEVKDINLGVGRAQTVDVSLKLGQVSQSLTVSENIASVNLSQAAVQGQITAETVSSIPLNGRNFLELAFLVPGNRPATNFDPTKTNSVEVSSAGQFGRGGNLTVDGGENTDVGVGGTMINLPQDSVQEFQIATNQYTAEVGESGSSIINIVTKSGTNDLHASLFGFFRNRNLQARSAVEDRTRPKPPFDRQQFGGSVGGRLLRDRAWFFVSVEDRNQHAPVQVGVRNFTTQQIVTTSAPAPLKDFLTMGRLDFKLSSKDNFFARYAYQRSIETANGSLQEALGTAANRQRSLNRYNSYLGNWTRTFSGNKVNTLIFEALPFVNAIPSFGPNNLATLNAPITVPNEIDFPGLEDGPNFRIPQRTRENLYQVKDGFSWVKGAHTLHFGGEAEKQTLDVLFDLFGSSPIFLTQVFPTQDLDSDGVINDLDIPIAAVIASVKPNGKIPTVDPYSNTSFGFYFQDDWKVMRNLTLNYGIRYEINSADLGAGAFDSPCPLPLNVPPTTRCSFPRTVLGFNPPRDKTQVGPRFGFAWDPFKKGSTVIRGGYGIYYDRVVLEVPALPQLLDGRALALSALNGSTCGGTSNGCSVPGARFDPGTPTLANPLTGSSSPVPVGINVVDPHAAHPRVQQFTLGVQRQIGQNWIVTADGIHNFGDRFLIGRKFRDSNNMPITIKDPLTGLTNAVTKIESSAKVWYDGLLVSVQKRPSPVYHFDKWTYGFNANYTLSKTFNYFNDDQIPFNTSQQVDALFGVKNLRLEKGYAPTDERHRLTLYGVLNAPYQISVSPILTIASSVPAQALVPSLNSRLPILPRNALGRQVTNGRQLNAVIQQWNSLPPCPAAGGVYPCNQGGALPLVNPNLSFGDKFASLDFRVTKRFTFFERHKVDLIGEAFNIFNVTNIRGFNNNNFSGRVTDITSASFYQALSTAGGFFGAGGPRAFQFALRYNY